MSRGVSACGEEVGRAPSGVGSASVAAMGSSAGYKSVTIDSASGAVAGGGKSGVLSSEGASAGPVERITSGAGIGLTSPGVGSAAEAAGNKHSKIKKVAASRMSAEVRKLRAMCAPW